MPQGTLANLGKSAFVRTPPLLAARIRRSLLAFPQAPVNILDPTAGEGDLLFPCRDVPAARLYGVYREDEEQSARSLFVIDPAGIIRFSQVYPDDLNPGVHDILTTLETLTTE